MTYLVRVEQILQEVEKLAAAEGKLTGFCIGNTSKIDGDGLYFTPIRNTGLVVAGSAIVYESHHAAEIARLVDGRVRYIVIDAEKKVGPDPEFFGPTSLGNIERAVRDIVRKSTILTYKGNDLTVEAIDAFLCQVIADPVRGIGGKRVAIIGAGNIGSKLALKLVERAAHVVLTRRDGRKLETIVSALNAIKPEHTVASVEGTTDNEAAAIGADILIGVTNGKAVITASMINHVSDTAVVLDGGKGCLHPEAVRRADERGLRVFRVDVRAGFEGQIAMLLATERIAGTTMDRRSVRGVDIVSAGLLAKENEIVVDDVHSPLVVYGVADGQGDFIRTLSAEQESGLEEVRRLIGEYVAD